MKVKPNTMVMTCLRPKDVNDPVFLAHWAKRCVLDEQISFQVECKFSAIRRQDVGAVQLYENRIEELQLEQEAVLRDMRPLQDQAWQRVEENVVTSLGRNMILDSFWRGSSYTQTVVMGLAGAGTKAAGDTQASHAGWLEQGNANAPTYTGNRKAVTMGAASSQSSVSPQQSYAITSTGTVAGIFMNNGGSATKDDTTGTLVSVVDFTGGNESVNNLDTLLVTYTFNG